MSRLGLIILLLALFVQSPVGAQGRQTALAKLKKMNVAFTGDDFILSIIAGDKAKVELFLAAGMSPNTIMTRQELEIGDRYFSYGQTALLFALSYEYDDIALLLLARGADVNQKGPNGV